MKYEKYMRCIYTPSSWRISYQSRYGKRHNCRGDCDAFVSSVKSYDIAALTASLLHDSKSSSSSSVRPRTDDARYRSAAATGILQYRCTEMPSAASR